MFCHLFYVKKKCICADSTYTLQSDTMAIFSPWRPPAPDYNGISITHTSLGHTPACVRRINGRFSSCVWKWKRYFLKYVFCYARKPPTTPQNGLDSHACVPDRICMKLSGAPWGQEKYSSIFGPIGQWSLTHASFNITVINKGRKRIPKAWPAATVCWNGTFGSNWSCSPTPPQKTCTHAHTLTL